VATGSAGERVVPITQLYVAILTTNLSPDELVTEIRVPLPRDRSGGAYEKLERKVGDYAVIGVGAQVKLDAMGNVEEAGIGLCNAGSMSIKATQAEEFLVGKPAAPDNVNVAAQLAMEASDPIEDDRGPVDYKRAMVRELTRRALERAFARARGGTA
jgi:carbon-monoxide dehydrogenase medium subunit